MKRLGILFGILALVTNACGFSLLGPYKPWMTEELGYRGLHDIGGPMNLGEWYRWNLPTITYGFDQSFIDYFGQDGVGAVEEAIAILNDLPPMSQINLDDYPTDSTVVNVDAATLRYVDLKSRTLWLLLHQLGLNSPRRHTYALRSRQADAATTNYAVIRLNFDPVSFQPSTNVNGIDYTYLIFENEGHADAVEYPGTFSSSGPAVADGFLFYGEVYTGLTRDDVGGLRFLLRTNTVAVEKLPVPVSLASMPTNSGPSASSWMPDPPKPITDVINMAPRPGVDKLTFVRMSWDTNRQQFTALTNVFIDTYYTNGRPRQQTLQRVITRPDILFRARDVGAEYHCVIFAPERFSYGFVPHLWAVSDTSRWINHDDINGSSTIGGPGVIPPGATIDFGTPGRYVGLGRPSIAWPMYHWASFDRSTNPPVVFLGSNPGAMATISTAIRHDGAIASFEWTVLGVLNAYYRIESTSDFVTWSTVTTLRNVDGHIVFSEPLATPQRFYRAVQHW